MKWYNYILAIIVVSAATQCKKYDNGGGNNEDGSVQIKEVWALGDNEKVFKEDINHPLKTKNDTWNKEDDNKIKLEGFYNEVVAFQVIVETGDAGANSVEIVVENPKKDNYTFGTSAQPYGGAQGTGFVEIFTQHYLQITEPSPIKSKGGWFYADAAAPAKTTGFVPDALIPSKKAISGKFGFPVKIGASVNQGFWIDVYLPRQKSGYPAGLYTSTVKVLNGDNVVKEFPLEILLRNEEIPDADADAPTVWTISEGLEDYYRDRWGNPPFDRPELEKMIKFEGHRHRMEVMGGFRVSNAATTGHDPDNPNIKWADLMQQYKKWFDGTGYSASNSYYGPGQYNGIDFVGDKYHAIAPFGTVKVLGTTEAEIQTEARKWASWFQTNAPQTKYFWYPMDEPKNENQFKELDNYAAWLKNEKMPIFTTSMKAETTDRIIGSANYIGTLADVIRKEDVQKARANTKGGDVFFYNGFRPNSGAVVLEGEAIDFRVNSWIMHLLDVKAHFIWNCNYWYLYHNKGTSPYTDPVSYEAWENKGKANEFRWFGNGDGILFYPGISRHKLPLGEDIGIGDALIPSIRLKNIRRGQQDALIFLMAKKKGISVEAKIRDVVPQALWEVSPTAAVPWSQNGEDYDRVINALRTEIAP